MDFLGHGRAAENLAALQHEGFQPGFRQIASSYQAVVPAADNDGVVCCHVLCRTGIPACPTSSEARVIERRRDRQECLSYFQSFSICIAALRPGAPMIP